MRERQSKIPVGTLVFMEEPTLSRYGVVVDMNFWSKRVEKEDPYVFESFSKCIKNRGLCVTPIMFLVGVVDCRSYSQRSVSGSFPETKIKNFTWMESIQLITFDDISDFLRVIKQIKCFSGGLSTQYLNLVMCYASEIEKYFTKPGYQSELCELYAQAFPGMKAKPTMIHCPV